METIGKVLENLNSASLPKLAEKYFPPENTPRWLAMVIFYSLLAINLAKFAMVLWVLGLPLE